MLSLFMTLAGANLLANYQIAKDRIFVLFILGQTALLLLSFHYCPVKLHSKGLYCIYSKCLQEFFDFSI